MIWRILCVDHDCMLNNLMKTCMMNLQLRYRDTVAWQMWVPYLDL